MVKNIMNILVAGAGITGCTIARLLKDDGQNVCLNEKLSHIGGLCYTTVSPNGFLYEPYGSRVMHSKNEKVKEFVKKFTTLNNYRHNKGMIIKNHLYHYPINISDIKKMPENKHILRELKNLPEVPDNSNFENYEISKFGKTLYELFIYNYTKKMWGIEPRELMVEWANGRLELRENKSELFDEEWQGIPKEGYTNFLNNVISGITVNFKMSTIKNNDNYDLILFTGRIDELCRYKHGVLPYRSMLFDYKQNEEWECDDYGTINLPDHERYIRKANFKILYNRTSSCNWIQYQLPIDSKKNDLPMYPVNTSENYELYKKYLSEICSNDNIVPMGRLGLYKYLNMDEAILLAMQMKELIYSWKLINKEERIKNIEKFLSF